MFLVLVLLVALVQLIVVYQIRQGQYREIERSELVARQLTQKEELQLYLYKQVGYDYKQYNLLRKVIQLESTWNTEAVGDSGLAYSLSQFHEQTFNWFSELSGIEGEYTNPYDQIRLTVWAFDNGYQYHWTTYKRAVRLVS
jgi:soluble lytic murein transglycosylase-like protein